MKKLFVLLFGIWPFSASLQAQHSVVEEFSRIPFEYPAYQDAMVTMMFGTQKQVKGNIYLDGSKFYFLQGKKPIEADLYNIHRIQFGDTTYIPLDTVAARIVAQDSCKMLVCVRTIDTKKMKGRNDSPTGDRAGEGLAFFQLDMVGAMGFMELNNMEAEEKARQFPMKREYYYILDGQRVPAKENAVLKRYDKATRKSLRVITENRSWSWKDERSLALLLEFL